MHLQSDVERDGDDVVEEDDEGEDVLGDLLETHGDAGVGEVPEDMAMLTRSI